METKLKMVYWKGEKFWVGKLLEHPEIMTQGETLEELEENMKDAYSLMTMDDAPAGNSGDIILNSCQSFLKPIQIFIWWGIPH
ncbi:MAG: type II toxin-antitoxin system HicB family antitoxin [Desulfosalsimonadaceae bacterium]